MSLDRRARENRTACQEKATLFALGIIAGATMGAIAGAVGMSWYKKHKVLTADSILAQVKEAFLREGPIEGAWIHLTKKPIQKFAIKNQTYTGGITRSEDGNLVQYEFVADAKTGTVIELYRL